MWDTPPPGDDDTAGCLASIAIIVIIALATAAILDTIGVL